MIHGRSSVLTVAFALLLAFAGRADALTVEVLAGKHDRENTIAIIPLPAGLAKAQTFQVSYANAAADVALLRQKLTLDGRTVLAVILPGSIKAGSSVTLNVVETEAAKANQRPQVSIDKNDANLTIRVQDKDVIRYNMAVTQPPDEVDKIFARSGYIHPVRSPSGHVITNDFPPKHLHHHGIWFPWTDATYEGQKVDFWNSKKGEGKVEFVKLETTEAGNVMAAYRTQHRFIGMKIKGGTTILNETWDVRVYNTTSYRLFDLDSTQTCATDKPLKLLNYYYGGIGLRGSGQWEGKEVNFICADGKTRIDGHATKQTWVAMYGKIDGKACGIAVLGHPSNFRAPQMTRIHPTEPFFNFAPCAEGEFEIVPGKPYVSKYRYVTFDGEPDVKLIDRLWNDYAEPVEVKVK
ncbi:MAG: PmoA family protein [Phycisphaeraceae bacterium]